MKKTYVSTLNWMAIILLSLGFIVSSCSKEEAAKPDNGDAVNLKKKRVKQDRPIALDHWWLLTSDPGDAAVTNCDLIAGQHINVGQVLYWDDGTYLYVKYMATPPWKLHEVHLYVGPEGGIPLAGNGQPKIGWFPYSDDNLDGLSEITIKMNVSSLKDCFTVAAHAVVENDAGNNETAWSKCSPVIALKTFAENVEEAGWKFAVNDGDELIGGGSTKWCQNLGLIYVYREINKYYDLYAWPDNIAEPVKRLVGSVHVLDNGSDIVLEVTAFKNSEDVTINLRYTRLYFGSKVGLSSYYGSDIYSGECPAYYLFPYYENAISDVHTFFLPNSLSTEFNSPRWGWYSTYCKMKI